MLRPLAQLATVVSFGLLLTSCGPPWTVLTAKEPSPLVGQSTFAVHPVDMSAFTVGGKSEQAYLAEKDAESRANWDGDKSAINEEFTRWLIEEGAERGLRIVPATGPTSAPFFIRPRVDFIEPGFYVGVASGSSKVIMTIQITTPDGGLLDEILVEHETGGSLTNPGTGHRLRDDGEGIGRITAEYLQARSHPEED